MRQEQPSLKSVISCTVNDLNGTRVSKVSFPNAADSRSSLNSQHHNAGAATMYSHSSPRHDFARTRNGRACNCCSLTVARTGGTHARMHASPTRDLHGFHWLG